LLFGFNAKEKRGINILSFGWTKKSKTRNSGQLSVCHNAQRRVKEVWVESGSLQENYKWVTSPMLPDIGRHCGWGMK